MRRDGRRGRPHARGTIEYAFDRYSFGRPLASYQALKHRFADLKLWVEACLATARPPPQPWTGRRAAPHELVSVAKSYIGDHAPVILQDCVQLHGGIGVTWDHDLHLYLRRVVQDRSSTGRPSDHRERIADRLGLDDDRMTTLTAARGSADRHRRPAELEAFRLRARAFLAAARCPASASRATSTST